MKVFITGALGFIGRTVAERLRNQGSDVVGIDLTADADSADGIAQGDTSRGGEWTALLEGCDLAIHTAAIVNNHSPMEDHWRVSVLGTKLVIDAAVAASVPRLVHLSSVRAFSDVDFPDGVDEDWPVRPDGHRYVDTKIASEQVVLQRHAEGSIDATIVRPGDVYGPGSVPWTIWPAQGMAAGFFVLPDVDGIFSPVYVDNLIDGILLAAGDAGIGQIFTISDGVGIPNEEFFGRYARMLGCELPLVTPDQARATYEEVGLGADTADYFGRTGTYSIDKARRVLGYEPAVDLDEGMARTEDWLRTEGLVD